MKDKIAYAVVAKKGGKISASDAGYQPGQLLVFDTKKAAQAEAGMAGYEEDVVKVRISEA